MVSKSTLRKSFLDKRRSVSVEVAEVTSQIIQKELDKLVDEHQPKIVALYQPIHGEIDLRSYAATLNAKSIQVALPRADEIGEPLRFVLWENFTEDPRSEDVHGVPCVDGDDVTPDMAVVPCVGFTSDRYRLGYGSGYYDRTFLAMPDCVRVGVAYAFQQDWDLKPEEHDIPMHVIITEEKVWR